ncbi:MAG TPA: corrinoid protein [Terriglobales bacterium]|nr:corrinoid protein [Terriglobales bacterium]
MQEEIFARLRQSIVDGAAQQARSLAEEVLTTNLDPLQAIEQGYAPGLQHVGEQFARGAVYLPDMIMASEAMKAAVAVLEPELQKRGSQRAIVGKVVLGTTKGDIHEIGKNLVGIMLAANSFQVFDLGTNVTPEAFAAKAQEVGADIVGVSALLTTTMKGQKSVVEHFRREGSLVKVMVGGAPASRRWAEEIGADGYAKDASAAVELAKSLVSGQPHGEEAAVASLVARSQ